MSKNENNTQKAGKSVTKKAKYLPDLGNEPNQPKIVFKKSKIAGVFRCFVYKWFLEYPWLHYNEAEDRVYCFHCVKCIQMNISKYNFSKATAFTYDGFNYWNKGPERFKMNENSEEHKEARCKIDSQKSGPVDQILNKQCESQRAANRRCLMKLVENVHFCAINNIAFRGHEDDDSIFYNLAKLRANDCPDFQQWIDKKQHTYMHKDIQNELLEIIAHKILREDILKPIQKGFFYQNVKNHNICNNMF